MYFYPERTRRKGKSQFVKEGQEMLHREIWKFFNGEIPPGQAIHHIDGNTLKNVIQNFECIKENAHNSEHNKRKWQNPEYRKKMMESMKIGRIKILEEKRKKIEERIITITELLRADGTLTIEKLVEKTQLTEGKVNLVLKELQQRKIIMRIGPHCFGGKWEVI
jgi:hypothetical protein